jgi:YfiH family protein
VTEHAGITVAALDAVGVAHGFGTRDSASPQVLRPVQVHGRSVAFVKEPGVPLGEADAVVSDLPGVNVAVVTADCVPILIAEESGRRVAAVHAGWRGLAAGIVEAAVAALEEGGSTPSQLLAAVGPCIGGCCYEVDAPVTTALVGCFGRAVGDFVSPSRQDHEWLDLAGLTQLALERAGVSPARVSRLADACTRCDEKRFHSHRRDGAGAGRMVHWISGHP